MIEATELFSLFFTVLEESGSSLFCREVIKETVQNSELPDSSQTVKIVNIAKNSENSENRKKTVSDNSSVVTLIFVIVENLRDKSNNDYLLCLRHDFQHVVCSVAE